jgi:inosine/xanthosine triphosphatase
MHKIAAGTTSGQKINYLKEVLNEFGIEYEIIPNEVESGVDSQPRTSEETKQGSINRAQGALNNSNEADFGIGIEAGYTLDSDRYSIFCWASIVDKQNNIFSAQSEVFKLPNFHNEILKTGGYLGDRVRDYLNVQTEEFKKVLANDMVERKPFIPIALRNVLHYYLNREEYI